MRYFLDPRIDDILQNKMPYFDSKIHKIDLTFWNNGLHEKGRWNFPPYGEKYYSQFVTNWIERRQKYDHPVIWMSLNPACREKVIIYNSSPRQADMVTEANNFVNMKLLEQHLPY
jgi:hypothetical protein